MTNLFEPNLSDPSKEQFDTLFQTKSIHIEKITSNGQVSDEWYQQEYDEWVVVLVGEGRLLFDNGKTSRLQEGEYCYIPKEQRHKVIETSSPTIWLAIHFKN